MNGEKFLARIFQNMSKSIYEKQNEPLLINCLCAQRKGYSELKIFNGARYFVSIGITTVLTALLFIFDNPTLEAFTTIMAIIIIIADKYFDSFVDNRQKLYAKIQQYFDINCFNEVSDTKLESEESIFTKSEIAECSSGNYGQKLKDEVSNWYEDYSSFSPREQIFYCQKENIRWSKKNIIRFSIFNIFLLATVIIIIIIFSIIKNIEVLKLVGIISCGLTFLDFSLDILLSLKNDYKRMNQIEKFAHNIESQLSCVNIYEEIINLQSKIFDYRCECLCIPDVFYDMFKSKDEKSEKKIVNNLKELIK